MQDILSRHAEVLFPDCLAQAVQSQQVAQMLIAEGFPVGDAFVCSQEVGFDL
jgi:hypothetical protein